MFSGTVRPVEEQIGAQINRELKELDEEVKGVEFGADVMIGLGGRIMANLPRLLLCSTFTEYF